MGDLHHLSMRNRSELLAASSLPAATGSAMPFQVLLAGSGEGRFEGFANAVRDEGAPPARLITAMTFRDAVNAVQTDPTLNAVLVDLALPGLSGAQGIERLTALRPGLPVIVIYDRCGREQTIALWRAGVSGMFPRSLCGRALIAALQEVLSGQPCALLLPPEPAAVRPGQADLGVALPEERAAAPAVALSPRERQVAVLIAKGQSNKEVARRLDLQEPTVKVYVGAIFRKLGVRNRTEAATRLLALNLV